VNDLAGGFDEIVLATGVTPRTPAIEGVDHPKVLSYLDVLRDKKPVGKNVAVIGAGGIGFDVSEYLTHEGESPALNLAKFNAEWGIDTSMPRTGGHQASASGQGAAPGASAAAQDQQGGRPAWARPRAGSTAPR
jgi:NADPH-dependent 2,4-dienoyl-CoA reductase/sulfur reductase-like enzyme